MQFGLRLNDQQIFSKQIRVELPSNNCERNTPTDQYLKLNFYTKLGAYKAAFKLFNNVPPLSSGNWNEGKFEDEGKLITSVYTYSGNFSGEEPAVGPGRFQFDTGCEQEGEYVPKRMVRRTNASREVFHVPVWRCLELYQAGPRSK